MMKFEAENAQLTGYRVESNQLASGGKLISFYGGSKNETGTALFQFSGGAGTYDIYLAAFDENDGVSKLEAYVGNTKIGETLLDQNLGSDRIANNRVEKKVGSVLLKPGDTIQIKGYENQSEHARLDYMTLIPSTSTPIPVPTPSPISTPLPTPTPIPTPIPTPVHTPIPAPTPTPISNPIPSPTPSHSPDHQHSPHTDDPQAHKEHTAMLNLVPHATATHTAVKNGSWFDPNTWKGGIVPTNGAKVLIPKGINVNYDAESNTRLFTLRVDGGLDFASDRNTRMVIDTFVVAPDASLTIGTHDKPIQSDKSAQIIIANNGAINTTWDPEQLSRGIIAHGTVKMHGQEKTSHLKVAQNPMAGDKELLLSETPQGWKVGDAIVLTGTRYLPDRKVGSSSVWAGTQDEELKITGISGNRITLDRALKYNHDTPKDDLKAYVANYSRNVKISTENHENLPFNQRGHVMFMHSDDVDVRYAEFFELGRTDKSKFLDDFRIDSKGHRVLDSEGNPLSGARTNIRGRYPVHFHRTGINAADQPATAIGNAVWGSPGWGFVHHESNLVMENNASYDVFGSGFVTESGNEIGAWRNNIAIKSEGMQSLSKEERRIDNHDIAHNGVGFWFQGRLVANENNVAAGHRHAGITYLQRGEDQKSVLVSNLRFPESARYQTSVMPGTPQIHDFYNNEVFASQTGLEVIKGNPDQGHDLRTVIDRLIAWDVRQGAEFQYTGKYTVKDLRVIASKSSKTDSVGINLFKSTEDFVINKADIEGFETGIDLEKVSVFGQLPDWHFVTVDTNFVNVQQKIKNFDPTKDKQLTSADLKPGNLSLTLDAKADLVLYPAESDRKAVLTGVKTDSIGTIPYLSGHDKAEINYSGIKNLLSKGYYTDDKGTRFLLIKEFISDRATGAIREIRYPITFDASWKDSTAGGVLGKAPKLGVYQLKPDVYYDMNEATGTTLIDSTGSQHNAMISGATWTNNTPDGSKSALSFNGVNDVVAIPDSEKINLANITKNRTISLWFNAQNSNSGRQVLYEEGGTLGGINIYLDEGRLYAGAWDSSTSQKNQTGTWLQSQNVTNGQWHNVTLTLDNNTKDGWLIGYMNGKPFSGEQSTGSATPLTTHNDDIGLGAIRGTSKFHDGKSATNTHYFKGMMDNVQIYNSALQPFEIEMLMNGINPAALKSNPTNATRTQSMASQDSLLKSTNLVLNTSENAVGEIIDTSSTLIQADHSSHEGDSHHSHAVHLNPDTFAAENHATNQTLELNSSALLGHDSGGGTLDIHGQVSTNSLNLLPGEHHLITNDFTTNS
jgi:hypothetical protein